MKKFNLIFILIFIFLFGIVSAHSYSTYSSSYNKAGGLGGFAATQFSGFDSEMCSAGTDFLLQVEPFGCEPAVVRSDLLEDQDVTVLCKIGATQINPLVDVEAIKTISISGRDYPAEVRGVGYFPAQAALGNFNKDESLNSPILNNLGYVAITLRQNPNESSMPDFVEGNLTATLHYDIENAFGVGNAEFYLPVLNDEDWENNINQYGFWNGRGYLRAESVNDESAVISVYSGVSSASGSGKQRVSQIDLSQRETSDEISLPGLSQCLASLEVTLNGLEDPDTRANLKINSDSVEVSDGNTFLDGKCSVNSLRKDGLSQRVDVSCREDDSPSSFSLFIYPKISLNVDGDVGDYDVGERLYSYTDENNENRNIYLGYVGSKTGSTSVEDLYVALVSLPDQKDRLSESEISSLAAQMNLLFSEVDSGASVVDAIGNGINRFSGGVIRAASWAIQGSDVQAVSFSEGGIISPTYDFKGKEIFLSGYAEGDNNDLVEIVNEEYGLESIISGGILYQEGYSIKENDEDTGFYFVKSSTGSPSLTLRKGAVNVGNSPVGFITGAKFDGVNCLNHDSCSEYKLSKLDSMYRGNFSSILNNVVSGNVLINENKLVLKKISFNYDSGELYKQHYDNAIRDFETVINSFGSLIEDGSSESYGERALREAILLSDRIGQRKSVVELCSEFEESYPERYNLLSLCNDEYSASNSEISSRDVFVNGKLKTISFEGIYEPGYQDYGAEVLVRGPNGNVGNYELRKDKNVYLGEFRDGDSTQNEYILLESVDEDSARIKVYTQGEGTFSQLFVTNTYTIGLGDSESISSGYTFSLNDVNVQKTARVSVRPSINYQRSESNLSFKVGIEKRAIQLSDEQINNRLDSLNNSINDLQKASDRLQTFNELSGSACLATGAVLTAKNFLSNTDGKAIARQKVMRDNGGWNEFCTEEVNAGRYTSLDDCFLENSDSIDRQVDEVYSVIQSQDQRLNQIEANSIETKFLTNDVVNQDKFVGEYSPIVSNSLEGIGDSEGNFIVEGKTEKLNIEEMKTILSVEGWENGNYEIEELRDIELYAELVKNNPGDEFYAEQLYSSLYDVRVNAGNFAQRSSWADDLGIDPSAVDLIELNNRKEKKSYNDLKESDINLDLEGIDSDTPVQVVLGSDGQRYFIALDDSGGTKTLPILVNNTLNRTYIYGSNGVLLSNENIPEEFDKIYFEKVDASSYENEYKNAEIRYYEEEPYVGYPAVVPFDSQDGWYAATKPKLPVGSQIRPYDDSGKINSFWLCNVGANGLEEFSSSVRDDICSQVNLGTNQPYNQFYGLSESQASLLISEAVNSINEAQNAHSSGVRNVRINGQNYEVGIPAVETPAVQCQDFMSPKECNILFNVCDPVVCPSSRCDFGGNYPVKDVVQSGIIGSIALCLPNAQEGIAVPVCTTGVQAGLDSWISVQDSYRSCLQQNLDTGETVGICDEIHSVYACQFFWEQSLPLAKVAIPKVLGFISGENTRGGGEYLGVQSAWDSARDSLDYFKQYYADDSYNAFRVRSVEQAGGEVCRTFASTVYPSGGEFLDSLTTPRSPPQFTGKFDEIPFTSATNPPQSQYKVSYHIYAGDDTGAYYQVYLQSSSGGSFFQDSAVRRFAGSGYIPAGEYNSSSIDFTAPSGYDQMCIVVNGQEECGFKQVSTSFAVNRINDLYLAEQSVGDVRTEEECVSGSASLYSLLNPNLQDVASDLIDPELYQKGITRICETGDPGHSTDGAAGTEDARWRDVGYCGDTNVRCWIDTDSVKEAVRSLDVEESVLNDTAQSYADSLIGSGDYISEADYSKKLGEIKDDNTNSSKKINLIDEIIDKVFFSDQKAQLYLLRGLAYGDLSSIEFSKLEKFRTDVVSVGEISPEGVEDIEGDQALCDPSVGRNILSVARDKIGEDTTRIEQGNEVYTRVCATFVSNVLIDAGVLPQFESCEIESIPERDAVIELDNLFAGEDGFVEIAREEWSDGLKYGDVVIWGCKDQEFCTSGTGEEFQHIIIFESYDGSGAKVIHDGGSASKISERVYPNLFGSSWYVTHVWRAGCSGASSSGELSYPHSFTLDEGGIFTFEFDGRSSAIQVLEVLSSTSVNVSLGSSLYREMGIGDQISFDLTGDGSNDVSLFLEDLNGEVALFVLDTVGSSGRIFIVPHDVGVVDRLNNIRFSLPRLNVNLLYFRYNGGWQWSPDLDYWMDASITQVSEGEYSGDHPLGSGIEVIESLDISTFSEGLRILSSNGGFEYPMSFDLSSFSDVDLITMRDATQCGDCGSDSKWYTFGAGNICDRNECSAIGTLVDSQCAYVFTGTPRSPSWNCQEVLDSTINYEKIQFPYLSYDDVELWKFSQSEREVIINSNSCSDCGDKLFNICDVEECKAISLKTGMVCSLDGFSCNTI